MPHGFYLTFTKELGILVQFILPDGDLIPDDVIKKITTFTECDNQVSDSTIWSLN